MVDSPVIKVIQPKKPSFWTNLTNKYSLVRLVMWYKHKRYPQDEVKFVDVKEEIDYNLFNWATDLAGWIARTSVSGFILWYLMYMLFVTGPPIHLFFAFGLVWWTFMRFAHDLRLQVRR